MQFKSVLAAAAVVALGTCVPQAQADVWDKLTYLTVKEPIQVPGAQLPRGRYAVRLLESQSNRYIVQFFSDDRSKLFASVLAVPNQKLDPVEDTQLRFYETRGSEPPALQAWFYPGDEYRRYYTWEEPRTGTTGTTTRTVTQTRTQSTTTSAHAQTGGSTSADSPIPQGLTAQREDIQGVTRALEAHSDAFEKEFQKAVRSSTVRIDDRESLVKLVDDLEDSFDKLKDDYRSNNMTAAHRHLHKALEVAARVNDWMTQANFKTTEATWSQFRQDLNTLAQAHGYALLENWGRGNASR